MFLILCLLLKSAQAVDDYGSVSSPDPYDYSVNSYVAIPCFSVVCGPEVGCFQPFIINQNIVTFPPFSACPEVYRASSIRFLTISRRQPNLLQSANTISRGSKVAIVVHGVVAEYNQLAQLTMAQTLVKKEFDHAVLVDWNYLADTYVLRHVPGFVVSVAESHVNGVLVGRVICNFVRRISQKFSLQTSKMRVVGHSSGANVLAQIGEFCQRAYGIGIGHLVGLDLANNLYRRGNYPLLNYTHAHFVDVILSTVAYEFPYLDQLPGFSLHVGAIEAVPTCLYFINPLAILVDQPPCSSLTYGCSHLFGYIVYISAAAEKCFYKYSSCPNYLGPSSTSTGITRFNCKDHPYLKRTCINTSASPLQTC